MIRVLVVDDHHIVREGIRAFFKRDQELDIIDEAVDGAEAIAKARQLRPDIVLMDLLLPVIDGVQAITTIRRELPETEVIALTSVLNSASVAGAIRAGAIGYLLKDAQSNDLRTAVRAAAAGEVYLAPQVSAALVREIRLPEQLDALTSREGEVLNLLAQGLSNKNIARQLQIGEDTVKTHVRHILSKLGVQSRTQAILAGMRLGLVTRTS